MLEEYIWKTNSSSESYMKNQAVFQLLYCRPFSSLGTASTDLILSLCKVSSFPDELFLRVLR